MAPYNVKLNPLGLAVVVAVFGFSFLYLFSGKIFAHKEEISLKELLSVSIELVEKAGQEVKHLREDPDLEAKSKGETKEGAPEYVTLGDQKSNRVILPGLQRGFPGLKVISEEKDVKTFQFNDIPAPSKVNLQVNKLIKGDSKVALNDVTVWVDPLDATQEYTEKLTKYVTVMICVAVKGKPVIGVVHKPWGETYWGWAGKGRSSNLPDTPSSPSKQTFIVSRSHTGEAKTIVKDKYPDADVVGAGGAGFKTLEVIQGTASAYVHVTKIKKWDICAGHALLRTYKHGKLTDLTGDKVSYGADSSAVLYSGLIASTNKHSDYVDTFKSAADAAKKQVV